jgi:ATP/maltotriose-dependent transcriptional regulator MalT
VERLPYALWLRAAYGTQRGLLADVEADASEGLQLARDTGQATVAVHLESTLAWVMGVRGDEARCRALVDSSAAVAAARGLSDVRAMADFALAELDLGLGRPEAALERLEAIAGEHGHPVWRGAATPVLAEAAAVAGQPERARPAVERFAAWAEQTGSTWAAPLVAGAQALLAHGDDTETGLREALRLQAAEPSALADARTNLHLGAHLRRRRRRAEARAHLRRALETFERLGAAGWAERAAAELRASGETARRRDPTTRDELTPQERQIARLVAAGASNREAAQQLFLSPRTVEYHLRKVFQKLGIASRAELAGVELP